MQKILKVRKIPNRFCFIVVEVFMLFCQYKPSDWLRRLHILFGQWRDWLGRSSTFCRLPKTHLTTC